MPNVYAVIMAGGAGTRFWPASRATRPKQLLPLGADPHETLIAATVRRVAPMVPPERVYIATGEALVAATARELPQIPRTNLLAEPLPRNTAPCIGWADPRPSRVATPTRSSWCSRATTTIADEPGVPCRRSRARSKARSRAT